jgi:hypothetical protein
VAAGLYPAGWDGPGDNTVDGGERG